MGEVNQKGRPRRVRGGHDLHDPHPPRLGAGVLAVRVDAGSVDALLSGSRFVAQLQPGRRVFIPPVEGFEPNAGNDIASAQDRLAPQGERRNAVTREVLVNRSAADGPVVHIWLYTT